jgi:hypothetical protein
MECVYGITWEHGHDCGLGGMEREKSFSSSFFHVSSVCDIVLASSSFPVCISRLVRPDVLNSLGP